ncbi:uncharacterized protein LOC111373595 [Olea europaea var. sylvestris]|uniref:uncharacterized protein LOC111373595 n=1 Tax=Olea europaea var. sylvestris TaxID=158386 RepID=UPI000C1D75E2|nr:uncharacterized protein LOC111373595 [Olea europaea var. sylvestris]
MEIGDFKRPRDYQLSFNQKEADPHPYTGVLVISLPIAEVTIPKILVDTGSALNILFNNTLKWMGISANFLRPYSNMVLGLSGALTSAKGLIKLKVESGLTPRQVKKNSEFLVFDTPSPYDAVMGQPLIFSLKAVELLYHYSIQFPTPYGVGEVKENRELVDTCQLKAYGPRLCNLLGVHMAHVWDSELSSLDQRIKIEGEKLVEELEGVQVCADDLSKELKIGRKLQLPIRSEIVAFLRQNLNVFVGDHRDMRGIDPKTTCHKLQVDPSVRSKQQKRRSLNPEKYEALNKEVQKLLHSSFL